MRTPVWLLLLGLLTACSGSAPSAPTGIEAGRAAARGGSWLHIDAERQGTPLRWEMRDGVTAEQIAAMPTLLVVSAHYTSATPGALPSETQMRAFSVYEDRLLAALRAKATLVAVLSWNQQHDWYFYTGSDDALATAHLIDPPSTEADLSIGTEPDAKGEFYTKLRDKVKPH